MSRPGGFYEPLNETHRQVEDIAENRDALRWLATIEARRGAGETEREELQQATPDRAEPAPIAEPTTPDKTVAEDREAQRWLETIEARRGAVDPERAAPDGAEPVNTSEQWLEMTPSRPEGHPAEHFTWSGHGSMESEERAALEWLAVIEARRDADRSADAGPQHTAPEQETTRVTNEPEITREAKEGAPRELSDREREFYDRFPNLTRSEPQDERQRDQGNERTMGQE